MQHRHKKRCTNCQDHEEMKRLLKLKLKEQLQRTSPTARNKASRTVDVSRGHRDILLTQMDYLLRTHVERTILLMVNLDRNKDFSVDFCVFVLFVTDF